MNAPNANHDASSSHSESIEVLLRGNSNNGAKLKRNKSFRLSEEQCKEWSREYERQILPPYNEFLRVEVKRIMAECPQMSPKEAFKNAVEKWMSRECSLDKV